MDIEKISKYLLTTVLKLLKGVPDLWRADVSRIIKELKEMAELESHAGERQRSVIRAHREFLIDEAAERLAYETYTRKGLRFWANQQELVCGYFSLFLVGGLYGIDVGLLLLVCAMSQDMNGAAAVGKLLIAFAVTASSTILAAMIGKRIYTHVALRKQFRLDILERIRDGGSGMDASFTQAVEKSYKRLHEYEETRRVWKYRILVLSCLLTASLLVLVAAMACNWWSGLIRCIGAVALSGPFLVLTVVLLRAPKLSEEGGTVNQTAPKMEAESHLDKTAADEPARAGRHDVHHHAMRILRYLSVFLFAFSLTGLAHSGKRSDPNHRVRGRC